MIFQWLCSKKTCGLCGDSIPRDAILCEIRYKHADGMSSMIICEPCGDRLEEGSLRPEDFDG